METEYDNTNFTDYGSLDEHYPPFLTPTIILETVIYAVPSVVALAADIILITLVATKRYLRSITNVYILQRVLSDLFGVCLFPVGILVRLGYLDMRDSLTFNVIFGIDLASLFASNLFLVLISMDCYLASRPRHNSLQYRWKVLKITSGVTWLAELLYIAVVSSSLHSVIDEFLRSKYRFMYSDLQPVLLMFFSFLVPVIICWIYVGFLFPVKSECVEASESESVEVTAPPRALVLALVTSHTALLLPYHVWDLLYFIFRRGIAFVLVRFMLHLSSPVACFLCLFLQKDLREAVMKCCQSRSTSSIPLENL